MESKTYIYTLSDSNGNVRYVGKSNDTKYRLTKHLYESKQIRTHKEKWINNELNLGRTIILEVIDEVPKTEWQFWETYWISQFKTWGFKLVNGTSGGEGSDGFKGRKHSETTKLKISEKILSLNLKPIKLHGELNHNAKLKDYQVEEIKEKVLLGVSRSEIANEYHISKKYIYFLINGRRRAIK